MTDTGSTGPAGNPNGSADNPGADGATKTEPGSTDSGELIELSNGNKVTLSELKNGYMRQDDYTRKRQQESERVKSMEQQLERAQYALQIEEALRTDPVGTIKTFKNHFENSGYQFGDDDFSDGGGFDDEGEPAVVNALNQRIAQLEEQLGQLQYGQQRSQVQSELMALQGRDPDLDPSRLAAFAKDEGLPLRTAYEVMKFRELSARDEARQREQQEALEGKRDAASVVTSGGSANVDVSGGASEIDYKEASWDDLKQATLQQLKENGAIAS